MAFVIADRVKETSTTIGTGSFTLAGAVTGYQTFASALASGDTTYYTIADQGGANWEVGIGTFTNPSTLARTTVLSSSNGGAAVTFGGGTKDVFISLPSSKTNTNDQPNVISVNSASNALRITQTGAGNALVVEDSANPDSTPFVVDATGLLVTGAATNQAANLAIGNARVQILGGTAPLALFRDADSSTAINLEFAKRRATGGLLASNDTIGRLYFSGNDGTAAIPAAFIDAVVDGTPSTNDMPGRLVFSTTADGASTPTERMRIDSAGQIGVGQTPSAGRNFVIAKNITGSTTSRGVTSTGQVQSDVTGVASYFATAASTANTTFTVSSVQHYIALQGTFGASSTVTSQVGFWADASLTGGTSNYGFYSNIASGTGRWNFYANGTAANYFAGQVQLGAGTAAAPALSTTGDTNTGIFFPAADTIAFSEGGVESMRIDSSGNVGIGTSSPDALLTVNTIASFGDGAVTTPSIAHKGDLNTGFWFPTADTIAASTAGTERIRIDSSGNFQFNSGYGSVATAYGCRAWVNFNGTGTVAIRGSGNVTSITDNGTGDYTVNFTNAMPDTNYAMIGQGGTGNGRVVYEYNGTFNTSNSTTVRTVSSCRILYADTSTGTASDNAGIYVVFYR